MMDLHELSDYYAILKYLSSDRQAYPLNYKIIWNLYITGRIFILRFRGQTSRLYVGLFRPTLTYVCKT